MDLPTPAPLEIRDPIHGAIPVDKAELAVVDDPYIQRLRGIRQLGFSHLPFPGATHSRYAHSLGAMHLAGKAFDACFRDHPFSTPERHLAYRHCVRLAALCHDVGHAPFSHAAEFAMPPLAALEIDAYDPARVAGRLQQRATHEDYTVALVTRTSLGRAIATNFGFRPEHVAALISPDVVVDDDFFVDRGYDLRDVFSQIISSDLDVDRLDYLVRDSYYTGARYGQVDVHWLISNLTRHVGPDGRVGLAFDRRALYAFDDFLIARFHMFVMVYFHQKSIAYEELLKRFMRDPDSDYRLPSDLDAYVECDDVQLWSHLRRSTSPWARRVVEHRPYRVVVEAHGVPGDDVDTHDGLEPHRQALEAAGIDVISASAIGRLFGEDKPGRPPVYVRYRRWDLGERFVPLGEATEIVQRSHEARRISRLYVAAEDLDRAREICAG